VFVEAVMALSNPRFVGVFFVQRDREATKQDQREVVMIWQFLHDSKYDKGMIAARDQIRKEGFETLANSLSGPALSERATIDV
jgi:hypothetical protein